MLIRSKSTRGFKLHGLDGDMGSVDEFYFDDRQWTVRYLVAETGSWLSGRQVLISPLALDSVDRTTHRIGVKLTRQQIEDSPSLETDKPVSRQFEASYNTHYGWPMYWESPYTWGPYLNLDLIDGEKTESVKSKNAWNQHLRSTRHVSGYAIHAKDGEIGHVDDFLIDTDDWSIRYIVVDINNWWPGKRMLVSPTWIRGISWLEATVEVDLERELIRDAPEFVDGIEPSREYETKLHLYYERKGYWEEGGSVKD